MRYFSITRFFYILYALYIAYYGVNMLFTNLNTPLYLTTTEFDIKNISIRLLYNILISSKQINTPPRLNQ